MLNDFLDCLWLQLSLFKNTISWTSILWKWRALLISDVNYKFQSPEHSHTRALLILDEQSLNATVRCPWTFNLKRTVCHGTKQVESIVGTNGKVWPLANNEIIAWRKIYLDLNYLTLNLLVWKKVNQIGQYLMV